MNIEHEILQIGIDASLRIYRSLFVSQKVVELNDTDRYSFILLSFEHDLFQTRVFNDLVGDDCCKVACFSNVPPVITIKRSVQVISQTLE